MLGKCSKSAVSMFQPKKDIPEHTKPVSCESFRVFDPYPHLSVLIRVPTFRSLLFWSFFQQFHEGWKTSLNYVSMLESTAKLRGWTFQKLKKHESTLVLQSDPLRRCLGTQNPLQNHDCRRDWSLRATKTNQHVVFLFETSQPQVCSWSITPQFFVL